MRKEFSKFLWHVHRAPDGLPLRRAVAWSKKNRKWKTVE